RSRPLRFLAHRQALPTKLASAKFCLAKFCLAKFCLAKFFLTKFCVAKFLEIVDIVIDLKFNLQRTQDDRGAKSRGGRKRL
ncbi:MAG: hypothetical protein ABJA75_08365, partial [Bradyrhizobium sp.]